MRTFEKVVGKKIINLKTSEDSHFLVATSFLVRLRSHATHGIRSLEKKKRS